MKLANEINVLIACEESQTVCKAFRERGFNAFSCDIIPCSGGHPEWHIQGDALEAIYSRYWDLIIAHPPCTYLTVTANKWLKDQPERKSGTLVGGARRNTQQDAFLFFMEIYNAPCLLIAVENPIGVISTKFKKPDQIIQPYQFGYSASKATCLWLKGLPLLQHTNVVDKGEFYTFKSGKRMATWYSDAGALKGEERQRIRNKTFDGIAKAMADQWGNFLLNSNKII